MSVWLWTVRWPSLSLSKVLANEASTQRERIETDRGHLCRQGGQGKPQREQDICWAWRRRDTAKQSRAGTFQAERSRGRSRKLGEVLQMMENVEDPCAGSKVAKWKCVGSDLEKKAMSRTFSYSKCNEKPLNIFEQGLISLATLFTYFITI